MASRLALVLMSAHCAHGFLDGLFDLFFPPPPPPTPQDPLCVDLKRAVHHSRVFCDVEAYAQTTFRDQFGDKTKGFAFGHSMCDKLTHQLRLVVRPRSTRDVSAVLKRLHERWGDVPVSMRSGGHSYTCNAIKRNSVHFDLRALDKIELVPNTIDASFVAGEGKLLTTGAGNMFKNLLRKVDARKYSFVHGECHGVGVGGFLLHGGYHAAGLSDRYGYGNSTIRALEVVVADGSVVRFEEPRERSYELSGLTTYNRFPLRVWKNGESVAAAEYVDLWDSLRVAGSSFGIVTEFTVQVWEEPEPTPFFVKIDLTFEQAIKLLADSGADDRIVANFYIPGVPLIDLVFQMAWTDGHLTPAEQQEEVFKWLTQYFVRTYGRSWSNWRQTKHAEWLVGLQNLLLGRFGLGGIGEAGHNLAMDLGLFYKDDWVTSSQTVDLNDPNVLNVMRWHKKHYDSHARSWFGLVPQCWLLFNAIDIRANGGSRGMYVDHSCWAAKDHLGYVQRMEHEFKYDFPNTNYVKYYNVPTWMKTQADEQQVLGRYFHTYGEMQGVKAKYDPRGVFDQYQGVRPAPAPASDVRLTLLRQHGTTTRATSGRISDGYRTYGKNLDRSVTVVGESCYLKWQNFDVEDSEGCKYDFVELLVGSQSLGKWCGTSLPPNYRLSGGEFTVKLHTDEGVEAGGFLLDFECQ